MDEIVIELFEKYPVLLTVLGGLLAAHALALFIVALTPTPRDDQWVARVYKVVEWVAGVVGRSKETGEKPEEESR